MHPRLLHRAQLPRPSRAPISFDATADQPEPVESPEPKVIQSAHGAVDLSESSTDQTEPSSSPATIDGDKATYEQVFEGVDAVYTSEPYGLKEELILHSAQVPTDYDYTVRMSPGLVAQQSETGIEFMDEHG